MAVRSRTVEMLAFYLLPLSIWQSDLALFRHPYNAAFQLFGRDFYNACCPDLVQKPSCLTECAAHHEPLSYTGAAVTQVTEFQGVASEFLQRLKTTGPGLPNTDLAKGLELLKKFQVLTAVLLLLIAHAAIKHPASCLSSLCLPCKHLSDCRFCCL
jgi:hypothetical protein